MLRQNSSHTGISRTSKTAAEALQEDADIEALRAAYRAVVTASAHSVFAAKALPGEEKPASEPLLNAYQAAVAAFANSVFAASGLPVNSIEHFQASIPSPAQNKQTAPTPQPIHPTVNSNPAQIPQAKPYASTQASGPSQQKKTSIRENVRKNIINTPRPKAVQTAPIANSSANPYLQPQPIVGKLHLLQPNNYRPTAPAIAMQQPTMSRILPTTTSQASEYTPQFDINLTPPPVAEAPNLPSQPMAASIQRTENRQPLTQVEERAMQDALEEAMGPVNQDNRMFAEEADFMPLPPAPETWLVKLFNRPKLAAGIIGMCILSSAVYAGLGYWWLNNGSISSAAEPAVNMLNTQENGGNSAEGKEQFNNLDKLQSPTNIIVPKETEEQTLLAQAQTGVKNAIDDIASIKNSIGEPTGRANPFAPLLGPSGEIEDSSLENKKKKDLLIDLQFIGFIGDINSKDKVAMIKVSDPMVGASKTVIKKAGESFLVEGERVVLKGISRNFLKLGVSGETRTLSISPYTELADTTASNSSAAGAGGATNSASPASPNGDTSGKLGNLGALSKGANPANPELEEPANR